VVTHQLQVERRTAKGHRPKTDALPLDHTTNTKGGGLRLVPPPPKYATASSHLATIDMGRKLRRGLCPLFGEEMGPHLTQVTKSPELRPTSIPSGILMHPAVWLQYTWAENWGLRPLLGRGLRPHLVAGVSR